MVKGDRYFEFFVESILLNKILKPLLSAFTHVLFTILIYSNATETGWFIQRNTMEPLKTNTQGVANKSETNSNKYKKISTSIYHITWSGNWVSQFSVHVGYIY